MKKVILFTDRTPTPDNYNGPSALLYHLIVNRPSHIGIQIYSTNVNKVGKQEIENISRTLRANISIVNYSIIDKLLVSYKLNKLLSMFLRNRKPSGAYYHLAARIKNEIDSGKPDLLWIYPHYFIGVAKQFPHIPKLITGPDCASLHNSRLLRDYYVYYSNNYKSFLNAYLCKLNLEKEWESIPNTKIHVVGQTDEEYLKEISPHLVCKFFPHPHYLVQPIEEHNYQYPIKVLISGKPDMYTFTYMERLVNELTNNPRKSIQCNVEFTMLGKQWIKYCNDLKSSKYKTKNIAWVDNYTEFIKNFDIQLFPISVGSGTKGKVLDALSNGLICIGSKYAFENIAIKPETTCLVYESIDEMVNLLEKVVTSPLLYKNMAINARKEILFYHNPEIISKELFQWALEGVDNKQYNVYYKLSLR